MTQSAIALAFPWGALVGWLFVAAVRRAATTAVESTPRRFIRPSAGAATMLRALLVAAALFAPALMAPVAVVPSLAAFVIGRNVALFKRGILDAR